MNKCNYAPPLASLWTWAPRRPGHGPQMLPPNTAGRFSHLTLPILAWPPNDRRVVSNSEIFQCSRAGRPGDANHCLSTNNDSLSPPPGTPSPASIQGVHEDPHIPRLDRRRSGSDPLHSIRAPLQWPNRTANLGRSSPGRSSNDVPQPAQLQDSVYVLTTHGDVQGEGVDVD